jgi:hypothetical protein
MGALIKKTEGRSGRHIFEASGPSLPFPNCQSGGGIARHCTLLPPQSSKLAGMSLYGRLCCKSLLSISAGNIDSRSSANTQQRFKRTGGPPRRVAKLYLPPGATYFGSRGGYGLTYTSCQESRKLGGLFRRLAAEMGMDEATIRAALNRGELP